MDKKTLGNKSLLYPMPLTLVGADVAGKANFMTIAFIGVVNINPGMVALGANRSHLTQQGIREHRTFSVNVPSQDMLAVADFVGLYSGTEVDKSVLFDVFYGRLPHAPMVRACPLNLECRVLEILDKGGSDEIVIGEIVESYAEDRYLTGGYPDITKMKPAVFSMYQNGYYAIGGHLGRAWSMGRDYRKSGHGE